MRRLISILITTFLFSANLSTSKANELHGTYQIDFVGITTPFGTPSFTETQLRNWVENANNFYSSISAGKIKLEFRTVYPTQTSTTYLDTPYGIKGKFPVTNIPKSATAVKSVLVGIMSKNPDVRFAGTAIRGGEEILFNGVGSSDTGNTSVFVHELGHILGLAHSNSIYCPPNTLIVSCEITEYGDHSDVMGTYVKSYFSYEGRFNGDNLTKLDLLPIENIYLANNSIELDLQPLYSTQSGYKLIYLPVYNRMGYSVEYRPATGNEVWLSQNRVFINSNTFYTNIPSHGLQVRVIGSQANETETYLPKTDTDNNTIYYNNSKTRQGFDAGESLTLPDGSTVSFISGSGESAVKVKIDRPVDNMAPVISVGEINFIEQQSFPMLKLSYDGLSDNRYVKSLELLLNGQLVKTITNPGNTGTIEYQLTSGKNFNYQLVATDAAGNKSQSTPAQASVGCTNKKCYVGATWEVEAPSFGVKLATAQLQEFVNKKWVTRTSSPQVSKDNLYTYNLKYSPKKAGTFTYRIYIPASAKWGAWIGKTFEQKVIG